MTSAKPQSMAGHSDAPDDLIAELARLMADDARTDKPADKAPSAPVRIPGAEPALVAPPPRFQFAASAAAQPTVEAATPAKVVRIPGDETPAPTPAATASPAPYNFDFDVNLKRKPAGPTTPVPAHGPAVEPTAAMPSRPLEAAPQRAPVVETPAPVAPPQAPSEDSFLDPDGLADLIAAELANDFKPEPQAPAPAPAPAPQIKVEDSFGVPPVFGLAGPVEPEMRRDVAPEVAMPQPVAAPAMPAPEPERKAEPQAPVADPLDEIERLVGPAVRLTPPTPSPALRSLATPVLPVEPAPVAPAIAPPSRNPGAGSVDDAILAAAAATGARVEWVDPLEAQIDEPELTAEARPERRPRLRIGRALAGPLVALALLLVAGGGLFWLLGQGGAPSGPAPLVVADTAATKEVPAVDTSASTQQSVVFNEISGANTGADEQIVSRDQTDEAVAAEATTPVDTQTAATSGVIAGGDSTAIDPSQDGLVNRKVRTVTVRPDGTIVSGDDSVAGASILPVDRPNVPDVPGANFETPGLIANAEAAAAQPTPAAEPATPVVTPATPGSSIPVADASGAVIPGRTVTVPMQRPADFAQAASAALSAAAATPAVAPTAATAATAPAATALSEPAATASVPAGGSASAYVQLSSQRSEDAARQSAQAIATRYGVLFGGASLEIQRVDLGQRGIYFRVLVPAASRDSAANICVNVKAAGGDCVVL